MLKKYGSLFTIAFVSLLSLYFCSIQTLIADSIETPYKITITTREEFTDGSIIKGNTVHEIDEENNIIIYTHTDGSLGGVEIYYKIKNNFVDVYSRVSGESEFIEDKDIPIEETPINSIYNLTKLNEKISDNNLRLNKFERKMSKNEDYMHDKIKNLESMGYSERENFLNEFRENPYKLNDFQKETDKLYITMNSNHTINKATIDKTEFSKLLYYLSDGVSDKQTIKLVHNLSYDYGNKINLSIPVR